MPPPTGKELWDRMKQGQSLNDILSDIHRDIPEPDTEEARLRASARLPLGSAETDPKLLQVERDWRKQKAEKIERAGDREGEEGSESKGSYDRYLNRLFHRQIRTPQTKEREKQKEVREKGLVTVPSHPTDKFDKWLGTLQSGLRMGSDVATGDIILDPALKAAGLDEESREEATRAGRGGAWTGTGFVSGLKAAKYIPGLPGKIAAPIVGALGGLAGRTFADLQSSDYELDKDTGLPRISRPTTAKEGVEAVSMSLGTQSILNTLKGAPTFLRMVAGSGEAGLINETTLQSISLLEKREPLSLELKEVWDRNKIALGLGGLIGKFAGGRPTPSKILSRDEIDAQLGKINNKLSSSIESLRKGNAQKLLDAAEKQGVHITSRNTFGSDLRKYADELEMSLAEKIKKLKQKADKDVGNVWSKANPKFLFEESRSKAIDALKSKVRDARFMGVHASTRGKRNAAKRLEAQLKKDIKLIEENPVMLVDNSNPRQMQRLLTIMGNKKAITEALESNIKLDSRALLEDELLYLNSLETGQAEDMARTLAKLGEGATPAAIARQVASYRKSMGLAKPNELITGGNIERLGEGWLGTNIKKYTTDPLFKWANKQGEDAVVGKALRGVEAKLTTLNPYMINRLYMGTADIVERAAQKTGAGEKSALFQLAKGLRKSVDDGNFLSADYSFRLFNKADDLGYGTYINRPETKIANEEFERFMKLRHSKAGGVRGDADDYLVADNLRIARSKDYYEKMSPMGRALVDGWTEASGRAGSKMKSLDVLVKMPDGSVRRAQKHSHYWPRKLKLEFEELIQDNFKLYDKKGEGSPEVKKMLKVFGAKDKAQLEEKLGGYIKMRNAAVMDDGSPTSFYSHLERARLLDELPPDAQDFSVDMAADYLHRSGTDLAKIENFGGQAFKMGAKGEKINNDNFIFNIIEGGDSDANTKKYVQQLHDVIFTPQTHPILTAANKATTWMFIANPSSAIKNLTGAFKTWTITGSEPMTRSAIKAAWNTFEDAASKLKGINKRNPDSELAKRIGATSNDLGRLTTFVDSGALTKGTRSGGQGFTGKALQYTGFTPAEDFVRKQGTIAADLARREWMDIFDASPNAKELVGAIRKLHADPTNIVLREKVAKLIKVNPKVNKKLSEAARFTAKQNIDLAKMADERFAKVQTMGQPKDVSMTFDPEAHPETRRFLQSWTKETQGGYKYDQLPLFMQNEAWRTFFKFQSWGQQMQRHFQKNIFGEAKEGNVKPLLKWMAAAQLSGEAIGQTQRLFGKDRTDAEYGEIAKALETDTEKGALMFLNRMLNNAALGGQWDLLGSFIGGTYGRYKQTGSFDPLSMPATQAIDNIKNTVAAAMETGITSEATRAEGLRIASALGKGTQLVREGVDYQPQRYDSAKRKLSRFVQERFLKESEYAKRKGRDMEPSKLKGRFSPTLASAQKSGIIMAVQSGDIERVKKLADEFVESEKSKRREQGVYFKKDEDKLIRDALGFTVERGQPLKVGTSMSEEAVSALKSFMEDKGYGDRKEILALQKQYMDNAEKAGFIDPPKDKSSTKDSSGFTVGRRGEYGLDKAEALARRFVLDNEMLLDKKVYDDKGNAINAAVDGAVKKYAIGRSSDRLTPRENKERELHYDRVISEVKKIASIKDKEKRLLAYMLPKDFKSIQNSWAKAEYLDEHFDLMGKPSDYATRKKIITGMLDSRLISAPDALAYLEYIATE